MFYLHSLFFFFLISCQYLKFWKYHTKCQMSRFPGKMGSHSCLRSSEGQLPLRWSLSSRFATGHTPLHPSFVWGTPGSCYILNLLWDSLLNFGKRVPGGATKYSSVTRWAFCSSSSTQLPSTTLSGLRYRHLQNQKLQVTSWENKVSKACVERVENGGTKTQHILEFWALLKSGRVVP